MNKKLTINSLSLALALALSPAAAFAQALPDGGAFRLGAGTITAPNGTTLNIGVSGSNGQNLAVIDWSNGFNVGAGNTVNFNNTTGRPLGVINVDMNTTGAQSNINGNLNAGAVNGNNTTVLVLNPQGVNVGGSAVINTSGAFVAGAGTLDDADANPNAPAGKVSVKLTSRFITIDPGAEINTGDSQGVGDNIAFMGTFGPDCFSDGAPCDPNYPGSGTGGASLPFISGQYTGNFYTANPSQANSGAFGSTFFLHGFNLDNSGAVYQFNGPYQFGLLFAETWDIDPVTGEEGNIYWAGGSTFQAALFGHLDLGNATFTTRNGDGGGFYGGFSGVTGGRFIVPDAVARPGANPNLVPNTMNFTFVGDVNNTTFISNGVGLGTNNERGTGSINIYGHADNINVQFGAGVWRPNVSAGGGFSNSQITSAATGRGTTINSLVVSGAGFSNTQINSTGNANVSINSQGTNGLINTQVVQEGEQGNLSVSNFAGPMRDSEITNKADGSVVVYSNGVSNSQIQGRGSVSVSVFGNGDIEDSTIASTGTGADQSVSVSASNSTIRNSTISAGGLPLNIQALALEKVLASGGKVNILARANITNSTIEGVGVEVVSFEGKVLATTIKGVDIKVSATEIQGGSVVATNTLNAVSETGLALTGGAQLEGQSVVLQAKNGDLNIGADGSAVLVRGEAVRGTATGNINLGQQAAVRVITPTEETGNNTIYLNTGTVGSTADVQASGHNWFGTVSIVDGALVLNPPETVVEAPANAGIFLEAGGTTTINGTLFAGEGEAPAPLVPFIPVVIRVFQDGDTIRWTGTQLQIKTDHAQAAGGAVVNKK